MKLILLNIILLLLATPHGYSDDSNKNITVLTPAGEENLNLNNYRKCLLSPANSIAENEDIIIELYQIFIKSKKSIAYIVERENLKTGKVDFIQIPIIGEKQNSLLGKTKKLSPLHEQLIGVFRINTYNTGGYKDTTAVITISTNNYSSSSAYKADCSYPRL